MYTQVCPVRTACDHRAQLTCELTNENQPHRIVERTLPYSVRARRPKPYPARAADFLTTYRGAPCTALVATERHASRAPAYTHPRPVRQLIYCSANRQYIDGGRGYRHEWISMVYKVFEVSFGAVLQS